MNYLIDYEIYDNYFSLWEVVDYKITKLIFTTDIQQDTGIDNHKYSEPIKKDLWKDTWIIMEVFEDNWNERFSGEWSRWSEE